MLKINKKVEYALISLKLMLEKEMGASEELTTAREISDKFGAPFDTTAKVMQTMNNAKILASVKGVKGGYKLSRDLSDLSYMELAELIEGKSLSMDCQAMKCNLIGTCNITGPIGKLNGQLDSFLRGLTVRELLLEDMASQEMKKTQKEQAHEL